MCIYMYIYIYVCVCVYVYMYVCIYMCIYIHIYRRKLIYSSLNRQIVSIPSVQFSHSVVPDSCDSMDCNTPGFPVHHQLLELTQTHVHQFNDAIQPSHPLLTTSPPTCNLSQYQGLFQWVSSSHQVAKGLEFQLQHQSFQWIFRIDFL